MYGERPGERLTDAERARLHLWLRRQGRITVELEAMTPLVEARYFVRYRVSRVVRAVGYLAAAMVVAWILWEVLWGPVSGIETRGTPAGLAVFVASFATLYALFLTVLWYQRRADRRIVGYGAVATWAAVVWRRAAVRARRATALALRDNPS